MRYSAGTLYWSQCPNSSTTSHVDLNYHIAKKHATPRVKVTHKCKNCFKEFSGFYALRQHKTSKHGLQMKSAEFDVSSLLDDDDAELKEKLQVCQHFLVDSELDKGRNHFFNFGMSTFDNSSINKKLDLVFKGLKCAAKVNLALRFVLKNVEDGFCRCFYAHVNNRVMKRSKLVCTPHDLKNLKKKLQKVDIIDLCTRERANTKWKFYKLTKLTVFAALLKDVPMGCNYSVLPEPLLKNQNVNSLTFEKKFKKALQWESLPFQSSCSALCIYLATRDGRKKHPKF